MTAEATEVIWFEDLGRGDVARVGGRNAPLGEMVRNLGAKGIRVPPGFATTADTGGAGVMFSIDTKTGLDEVVVIDAARGLGENVVRGSVDPDEYAVFKPLLSDPALAPIIERKRGGKAQKMLYARDGESDQLFIGQARPETVQSRRGTQALKTCRITHTRPATTASPMLRPGAAASRACRRWSAPATPPMCCTTSKR